MVSVTTKYMTVDSKIYCSVNAVLPWTGYYFVTLGTFNITHYVDKGAVRLIVIVDGS